MASSERIDELKRKFDENPRRYFAPLANEFRKSGDLDQAILICQEFLPQQPGHMSGHIVYGQALYEAGRIDEARGVFETALSLDPENLIALRHLGDIAARQGDATSARRWYERVLETDPRNDEIQGLLAHLEAAPAADAAAAPQSHGAPESEVASYAPEPHAPLELDASAGETPNSHGGPDQEPELLDFDVAVPEASGHTWEPADTPHGSAAPSTMAFDPTTIGDIEPMPETADLMPAPEERAEGFEPTEFTAPDAPVEQAEGLESAFEVETGVHVGFFQSVSDVQLPPTEGETQPARSDEGSFPELDEAMPEDRGDVVPPHGDPIAQSAVAPAAASDDDALLDFDMPVLGDTAAATSDASADEPPVSSADASTTELADVSTGSDETAEENAAPTIPTELPPEVIAAEAELIDAGVTPAPVPADEAQGQSSDTESAGHDLSVIDAGEISEPVASEASQKPGELHEEPIAADEAHTEPAPAEHRLFVTETMAELYLKQGLRPEALSVYEQLSSASPGDERLAARVASLRAELASLAKASGPRVRDFFASFAVRRPGERAAASAPPADDDFGGNDSDEFSTPPASTRAVTSTPANATEASASASGDNQSAQPGGSIDALFGNQAIGGVEDSAASALAQAFGTDGETTPLAGNPTRPASGELTLDSVFREGPRGARSAQGFSFDQFFSQNVEGEKTSGGASDEAPASGEPAERSEDDIEQFNSWLQGLKQR
jgi:hypothetical protein